MQTANRPPVIPDMLVSLRHALDSGERVDVLHRIAGRQAPPAPIKSRPEIMGGADLKQKYSRLTVLVAGGLIELLNGDNNAIFQPDWMVPAQGKAPAEKHRRLLLPNSGILQVARTFSAPPASFLSMVRESDGIERPFEIMRPQVGTMPELLNEFQMLELDAKTVERFRQFDLLREVYLEANLRGRPLRRLDAEMDEIINIGSGESLAAADHHIRTH